MSDFIPFFEKMKQIFREHGYNPVLLVLQKIQAILYAIFQSGRALGICQIEDLVEETDQFKNNKDLRHLIAFYVHKLEKFKILENIVPDERNGKYRICPTLLEQIKSPLDEGLPPFTPNKLKGIFSIRVPYHDIRCALKIRPHKYYGHSLVAVVNDLWKKVECISPLIQDANNLELLPRIRGRIDGLLDIYLELAKTGHFQAEKEEELYKDLDASLKKLCDNGGDFLVKDN